METRTTVLVLHNRPILFEGIKSVLGGSDDFQVLDGGNTTHQIASAFSEEALDVFLLAFGSDGARFREAIKRLVLEYPEVPLVVLSPHCSLHFIQQISQLGAKGFICEAAPDVNLQEALRSVASGHYFLGPFAAEELVSVVSSMPSTALHQQDSRYELLTSREREVFRMLAEGKSNKQIAFALGISRKTAETHHSRVCQKLNIHEPVDLFRYATRLGIIDLE